MLPLTLACMLMQKVYHAMHDGTDITINMKQGRNTVPALIIIVGKGQISIYG